MTRAEFEKLVLAALRSLPKEFKDRLKNVDVVIEERAPAGSGLLALYEGIPLSERGAAYGPALPDKITLFRQDIERLCRERSLDLADEVKHTIQHEIAHHFGISDARLEDLDIY